jgi:hypothetical protein
MDSFKFTIPSGTFSPSAPDSPGPPHPPAMPPRATASARPSASARTVVSLHGKDVGAAFRNNLIIAPTGCPLVTSDHDTDEIIFQANLYWSGGRPFKTAGAKTCDSLETWRKTGKEILSGKAVGLFADPMLKFSSPPGQAGDLTRPGRFARYQPTAASPVVDAGVDLKARFNLDHGGLDFLGTKTATGNPPDIGAIERRNGAAGK